MSALLDRIDEQTRLAGHNRLALLIFGLGDSLRYAVNVFKVLEVTTPAGVTPVAGVHPLVQGLSELRGQLMPVIALPQLLGRAPPERPMWVVTEFNRRRQAFIVGHVERIHDALPNSLRQRVYGRAIDRDYPNIVCKCVINRGCHIGLLCK